MIKKTGNGWTVYDESGRKKLSKEYSTKKGAEERLKQIEYFKKKKKR